MMITSSKFFNKTIFYDDESVNPEKLDADQWQPEVTSYRAYAPIKNMRDVLQSSRKQFQSQNKNKSGFHTLDNTARKPERPLLPEKSIKQIRFDHNDETYRNSMDPEYQEDSEKYSNAIWLPKVNNRVSLSYKPEHLKVRKSQKQRDSLNFIGRKSSTQNKKSLEPRGGYRYYSNKNRESYLNKSSLYRVKKIYQQEGSKYDIYDQCTKKISTRYKDFNDSNIFFLQRSEFPKRR